MSRRVLSRLGSTLGLLGLVATSALAQPVGPLQVPGTANIFYAGVPSAPPANICVPIRLFPTTAWGPSGRGDGTSPILVPVPPGATTVTIDALPADPATWGAVQYHHYPAQRRNTADGDTQAGTQIQQTGDSRVDEAASGGLSGLFHATRHAFLAGVFLDDGDPTGQPAPVRLTYNEASSALPSYSPLLRQTFFIGDGRDVNNDALGANAGNLQVFQVPAGATRLYLGLVDGLSVWGRNQCYGDNLGAYRANVMFGPYSVPSGAGVEAVPVGGGLPWLGLCAALLVLAGWSLRRGRDT